MEVLIEEAMCSGYSVEDAKAYAEFQSQSDAFSIQKEILQTGCLEQG